MEGVTILATEQVVSSFAFNWWAFVIGFVAIALFSLLLGYLYDILDEVLLYVLFGVLVLSAVLLADLLLAYQRHMKRNIKSLSPVMFQWPNSMNTMR